MRTGSLMAALLAIAGLTLAGGWLHGRMTNRWAVEDQAVEAGRQLEELPDELNGWSKKGEAELGEAAENMLQCYGDLARAYSHTNSGDSVQMSLLVGPTGPISEHTAEVCMPSREYSQTGARLKATIGQHDFWYVDFQRNDVSGYRVRVYWAWSTGGPWEAPVPGLRLGGARTRYVGQPYLYKLQVQCVLPARLAERAKPADADVPADPAEHFLRDALPTIQGYLR